MIKSRTRSERSVVVADVVLVVVAAGVITVGHGHDDGHVYDYDLLQLSWD
jgi:hypothetical protein